MIASILDYVGKFLPRETLVASQGLQAADCSTSSCAHEPLLELDGKKIVGSHRCKHCGLNKSYWNAKEL